jgi:hypothetical protein
MFKLIQALIFLAFFSLNSSLAQDFEGNIYLVEAITSKAVSKTANEAKIIVGTNVRRDAFMMLLTRLKLPIATSDNVTDAEIAEMVRSEQVVNEKISKNSYSATFNIIFAKDFVEHILAKKFDGEKIKQVDKPESYSEKITIIPVKMAKIRPLVWEQENDWKVMLERVIAKNRLQKNFAIPEANIENVTMVNGQNIKNIAFSDVEKISSANNSEAVYLLFFNFDEIENKVLIEVVYLRKLLKRQFRLSFINVDRLSYNDLIIKVAEKTLEYLGSNTIGSDNVLDKNIVNIRIKISTLDDWLNIKKTIENANIVEDVAVSSISRDEVKAKINYNNTKISIEEAFRNIGISISKQDQGFYEINAISQ